MLLTSILAFLYRHRYITEGRTIWRKCGPDNWPYILWLTDSFDIFWNLWSFLSENAPSLHFYIMYYLREFIQPLKSIHELPQVKNQLFFKTFLLSCLGYTNTIYLNFSFSGDFRKLALSYCKEQIIWGTLYSGILVYDLTSGVVPSFTYSQVWGFKDGREF